MLSAHNTHSNKQKPDAIELPVSGIVALAVFKPRSVNRSLFAYTIYAPLISLSKDCNHQVKEWAPCAYQL